MAFYQILLRRGTTAQRLAITPAQGEPFWDTELKKQFVGDGATPGGTAVDTTGGNVSGSTHDATTHGRPAISAAGTTNVAPGAGVSPYVAAYTIGAGSGSYTANLVLMTTSAARGDMIHLLLDLPASTQPVLRVYNGSTGGTLLKTVACDGSGTDFWGVYVYDGAAWQAAYGSSSTDSGSGGSASTVIYKAADTTRAGGSYTIDPDLQVAIAANARISGKIIVSLDGADSGDVGLIAPAGCKVSASLLDGGPAATAGGTMPISSPWNFIGVDGSALASAALNFAGTSGIQHAIIILFWAKNGGSAGNFGLAWDGSGGTCTVQAGSCLDSTISV